MTKARRLLAVWLAIASLWACGSASSEGTSGTIEGTVMGWPGPTNHEVAAGGAVLRFEDQSSKPVATATTDAKGHFATTAPAGHYQLLVVAFGRDAIILTANGADAKTTQVYVTVKAGQTLRLDLVVDTGLR